MRGETVRADVTDPPGLSRPCKFVGAGQSNASPIVAEGDQGDARVSRARAAAAQVCDPEIPSLTLEDLGILRAVELDQGLVLVTLVPTYTGCPATDTIRDDVCRALEAAQVAPYEVRVALSPVWSTDWITAAGRRKLLEAGIAPPGAARGAREAPVRFVTRSVLGHVDRDEPACPLCGSEQTERLSEFGSTACKALYRCLACAEPFDYFKPY